MTSAPGVPFRPVEVRTRKGRTLRAREYLLDDFGALVEMYKGFEPKRIAQGLPPPDVPRIAHWLDEIQSRTHALLAVEGQRVTGHTILCPISPQKVEFCIFVHQDFREEGVGTALSQSTLEWAAEMGFEEVYLTTELSNFPALALFRKLGFQVANRFGEECEMKVEIAHYGRRPQAA